MCINFSSNPQEVKLPIASKLESFQLSVSRNIRGSSPDAVPSNFDPPFLVNDVGLLKLVTRILHSYIVCVYKVATSAC